MLTDGRVVVRSMTFEPVVGRALSVVALGRTQDALRCRVLGGSGTFLLRPGLSVVSPVEGEVFTLEVGLRRRIGHSFLVEGTLAAPRLDMAALGLEPLVVAERENEVCEIEEILPPLPGEDRGSRSALAEISQLWEAGDLDVAAALAGDLLARDLRCISAHVVLGALYARGPFEQRWTERALRHFRVARAIGDLSVSVEHEGRLPWGLVGNRSYLESLYGGGLCLWRIGQTEAAIRVLSRLERLDPTDHFDVEELIVDLRESRIRSAMTRRRMELERLGLA